MSSERRIREDSSKWKSLKRCDEQQKQNERATKMNSGSDRHTDCNSSNEKKRRTPLWEMMIETENQKKMKKSCSYLTNFWVTEDNVRQEFPFVLFFQFTSQESSFRVITKSPPENVLLVFKKEKTLGMRKVLWVKSVKSRKEYSFLNCGWQVPESFHQKVHLLMTGLYANLAKDGKIEDREKMILMLLGIWDVGTLKKRYVWETWCLM